MTAVVSSYSQHLQDAERQKEGYKTKKALDMGKAEAESGGLRLAERMSDDAASNRGLTRLDDSDAL